MLRDGIEDYEYLTILRGLLRSRGARLTAAQRADYEALLTVPPEITANITTFTTDPAPIEQRRQTLAQAVVELLQIAPSRPLATAASAQNSPHAPFRKNGEPPRLFGGEFG